MVEKKKKEEMLLSRAYLIAKDNLKLNMVESIKLLVTVLDELSGSLAASFSSPARYRQVAIRVSFNYVPETWPDCRQISQFKNVSNVSE